MHQGIPQLSRQTRRKARKYIPYQIRSRFSKTDVCTHLYPTPSWKKTKTKPNALLYPTRWYFLSSAAWHIPRKQKPSKGCGFPSSTTASDSRVTPGIVIRMAVYSVAEVRVERRGWMGVVRVNSKGGTRTEKHSHTRNINVTLLHFVAKFIF